MTEPQVPQTIVPEKTAFHHVPKKRFLLVFFAFSVYSVFRPLPAVVRNRCTEGPDHPNRALEIPQEHGGQLGGVFRQAKIGIQLHDGIALVVDRKQLA